MGWAMLRPLSEEESATLEAALVVYRNRLQRLEAATVGEDWSEALAAIGAAGALLPQLRVEVTS